MFFPFSFLCRPKCHFLFQTLQSASSGFKPKRLAFSVPSFTHFILFLFYFCLFPWRSSCMNSLSFAFRIVVCGRCSRFYCYADFPCLRCACICPCNNWLPHPALYCTSASSWAISHWRWLCYQIRRALMKVWKCMDIGLLSPAPPPQKSGFLVSCYDFKERNLKSILPNSFF